MTSIGSMSASLSLEAASFYQGMQRAAAQTQQTSKAISAHLGTIATAAKGLAAVMAVDFFAAKTKEALAYADAIADLSDRTGASTKLIQEFGYAAQLAGSDVETARAGLEKFAKLVGDAANGSESAQKKLAAYGVTALDVDTAVKQASDTISKMDSPSKQLAATMDLMGKKAGTLAQTMAGGTKGLELQARAAKELGVVLSDDLVRQAGQVNDKLDTMKMIMDARMASMINSNADALASLAGAVTDVTGSLLGFWKSNPREVLALMGALAGAAMTKSPWGALAGGLGGFIAGGGVEQSNRDNSMDLRIRQEDLAKARRGLTSAETSRGSGGLFDLRGPKRNITNENAKAVQAAADNVQFQVAQMHKAVAFHKNGGVDPSAPTGGVSLPSAKPSGGGKSGPSAAETALKEAERAARYAQDVMRGQMDILRNGGIYDQASDLDHYRKLLTRDASNRNAAVNDNEDITVTGFGLDKASRANQEAMLGGDIEIRYNATKREILARYEDELSQIELSVKRGDIKAGSEAETLKAQLLYQRLLDENAADWEQRNLRAQQLAETELTSISIQRDALGLQNDLARTAADRRKIALQILELEMRERDQRLAQAQIGLDPNGERYKNIQRERDANQAQGGLLKDRVIQSTMGPLASFLDAVPQSAAEANEALQSIAVQGLDALNSGIVEAIMGAKSFGDAFEDVAKQVISAILSMAVKMAIIQPIAGVLGSAFGIPARANGGLSSGGFTLVGERGPEIVDLPGGANVIPHHALKSMSGRSSATVINVDARGSTDEALVQEMVIQGIQQAMPQITQSSHRYTMGRLGRPNL